MNRKLIAGTIIQICIVLSVILLPLILPSAYEIDGESILQHPSLMHLAGTDALGRDLLARTLSGGRTSLYIGIMSALCSAVVGTILGIAAASFARLDSIILAFTDLLKAVPSTLLAVLFMCLLGPGRENLIIVLTIVNIPQCTRLIRSRMQHILMEEFTLARISTGVGMISMFRSYIRHLLPILLVQIPFVFASSILAESALSFIGAGVLPPSPSLGNILSEGRSVIFSSWYVLVSPSVFILLSVLSLNLIGEGFSLMLEKQQTEVYS